MLIWYNFTQVNVSTTFQCSLWRNYYNNRYQSDQYDLIGKNSIQLLDIEYEKYYSYYRMSPWIRISMF